MNGVNELTNEIIGAAIEVHRTLGPGLLESTYEGCLLASGASSMSFQNNLCDLRGLGGEHVTAFPARRTSMGRKCRVSSGLPRNADNPNSNRCAEARL
jgi:hypothetical protein